jgi:hypothetical protein
MAVSKELTGAAHYCGHSEHLFELPLVAAVERRLTVSEHVQAVIGHWERFLDQVAVLRAFDQV